MPEKFGLTPTMSVEELRSYFMDKLPYEYSPEKYAKGTSCYVEARLILDSLGGPSQARIMWLYLELDYPEGEFTDAHAYVIENGQKDEELAYGNESGKNRTVGFLKEYGVDITEDVLAIPWSDMW